jgi:hypothetical protein
MLTVTGEIRPEFINRRFRQPRRKRQVVIVIRDENKNTDYYLSQKIMLSTKEGWTRQINESTWAFPSITEARQKAKRIFKNYDISNLLFREVG